MAKTLTLRVIKAISLLGSTQGLNMLCSIVGTKVLSILTGTAGVALMGALSQAADMIGNITQLNVRTSAVPQLSAATPERFSDILVCVRRYGRLLGCTGMILMFLFAPWLSDYTFGSTKFAWAYRITSLSVLFQALQGTELVVLQATSRYQSIAASGLFTSVAGVIIAISLYWGLRVDGIAPTLVTYSLLAWLGAMWFTRNVRTSFQRRPSWAESLRLGRGFIVVGAVMTLTSVATDGTNFIFMGIVNSLGEDVLGLYQAGYKMVWRYAAIFFSAFAMEFYPRLSKSINKPHVASLLLTHQARVSTLMFAPCAAAVILLAPLLVRLLYTSEFIGITPYVVWGMVASVLRPLSVSISFSFLAAGRAGIYAVTEVLSCVFGLCYNIAGIRLGGFTGLGIAMIAWMLTDLIIMLAAARIARAPMPRPDALAVTAATTVGMALLALIVEFVG